MAATYTAQRKAALQVANEARKMLGLEPMEHLVPGTPCNHECCAISNTVKCGLKDMKKYGIYTYYGGVVVSMRRKVSFSDRPTVMLFLSNFDDGKFPDLVGTPPEEC